MKTAKTTVTILSALASVVLLSSCATKSTETQTSNNNSADFWYQRVDIVFSLDRSWSYVIVI